MHKFRSFFAVLFVFGVVLGGFGREFCTRSNKNYAEPRSESFVPDVIETVLHDEELQQIYVCYNDANCVNVYSDSGEFLWAVATPYIRNSYFVLQDGKLIVFGIDNFYVYDSADGAFIGREEAVGSDFAYDYENVAVSTTKDGKFCFDAYRVYKINSDGTKTAVVSRPWWHWIFHFAICMCIIFVGALGVGITVFAEKAQSYNAVKKPKWKTTKQK